MAKRTIASSGATASRAPEPATTQRAYTLRLRRAPGSCPQCSKDDCDCWRDALWATHEAINRGAKLFGDWLLTLRGGLCHKLAQPPAPAEGNSRSDEETAALRKNRRILLALSWLSVEDEHGAPIGNMRVATGRDSSAGLQQKVFAAFLDILKARGVDPAEIGEPSKNPEDQPGTWIGDCGPSLSAAIREDSVWINRSAAFDAKRDQIGSSLTRDEVWDVLEPCFGSKDAYFAQAELTEDGAEGEEKAKRRVQKVGQWLSARFGTGKGADFQSLARAYEKMANWASQAQPGKDGAETIRRLGALLEPPIVSANLDSVLGVISGPGYKSATRNHLKNIASKTNVTQDDLDRLKGLAEGDAAKCRSVAGRKGRRPWADSVLEEVEKACGFTYLQENGPARHWEFSVMLDHAARRGSSVHSWIKRAEAERQRFTQDAERIKRVPHAARTWLDRFCAERSETSGAAGAYRIRRRAIEGWDDIVRRWSSAGCRTAADRVAAAREVQADPEIDKFGDIQLFEALAADDAECVWRPTGTPTPDALKDYVAATDARANPRRFKVPAYRHPDALAHPVFCDFGNSRWDIRFAVHEAAKAACGGKRIAKVDQEWIKDRHGLRMGLWDGQAVRDAYLHWSAKRLLRDLVLRKTPDDPQSAQVSRADRLGRAAAGLDTDETARVAGLFELPDWNGRLQAPRAELHAIWNRVVKQQKGWDATARAMRDRLGWLVSFSARLQCRGLFVEYAARHGLRPIRKGENYPHGELNKRDKREGHAKLILSRLPGLRVLSVDLGHRYAAACAVWEALPSKTFETEVAGRKIIAGGLGADELYCHTRHNAAGTQRTTIYRRIGPDKLPNGSDHSAPWARLDRQFLIKLQGEDRPARAASPEELAAVRQLEADIGRVRADADPLPRAVDALMAEAVRMVRLALRRHGDTARVAYAFKPDAARLTPGGGAEPHTPETRAAAILDALLRWHELATGARWRDAWAAEQWTARVEPRVGTVLPALADDADRWERRRHRAAVEQALKPLAESLSAGGTAELYRLWSARWADEDGKWRPRLRRLRDWLLPRGLRARPSETVEQAAARKARRGAARNVGGLSLIRIATLRELYQVQKAYAMRPGPDDPRKRIAARGDDRYDEFGRSVLQVVERLREQRVKLLASRITEAALAVGRMKPADRKRPRCRVDAPCHAVVIESLRNYRPDELRTRRENRALMSWSAAKVCKYLEEACQLHGLHLREVTPNYTSRQCSRTARPGLRCDDVPIEEFLIAPWWTTTVNAADKRLREEGADALDRMLVALRERWSNASDREKQTRRTLRLPRAGGNLFVPAPSGRPADREATRAIQADLNAAANIGLRALLDPDFHGKWWYIPCDSASGRPTLDRCSGAACLDLAAAILPPQESKPGQRSRRAARSGERTNAWRNLGDNGVYREHRAYWNDVRARVVSVLCRENGVPNVAD